MAPPRLPLKWLALGLLAACAPKPLEPKPTSADLSHSAASAQTLVAQLEAARRRCAEPLAPEARAAAEAELTKSTTEALEAMRTDGGVVVEADARRWVDAVGAELAQHLSSPPRAGRVVVTDRPRPGAWGVAPGLVAVSAGLLADVSAESELAFVVAHELVHLHLGHRDEAVTERLRLKCEAEQAFAGAALTAPIAASAAGLAVAQLSTLSPPPRDELTVDAQALKLVIAAGWDPRAAPGLLDRHPALSHGGGEPGARRDRLLDAIKAWRPPKGFKPRHLQPRLPPDASAR